jgi:hypothetical protein
MSFIQRYRNLILVIVAILVLVVVTPLIEQYVSAPKTEPLTELSILGSYHNATYPYNLTSGDVYPLYVTINNELGSQARYKLEVKFRNQDQSGPDSFDHTASSLPSLAAFTFEVDDGKSVESQINLEFTYHTDSRKATLDSIVVNGTKADMDNLSVEWDSDANAYLGNLFFELYLYDASLDSFVYHQRYVSLWVNLG